MRHYVVGTRDKLYQHVLIALTNSGQPYDESPQRAAKFSAAVHLSATGRPPTPL